MSRSTDPFLIAALSGRALMQSAQCGGFPAVVLDVFGDMDMRSEANAWARVGDLPGGFDAGRLLAAAQRLAPAERCAGLVYGSGFESQPHLLAALAQDRPLYGNAPETLAQVCDPHHFFPVLDRLGIPHPAVRYTAPSDPDRWLGKRVGSSGGAHVRPARQVQEDRYYFQRHAQGDVLSVAFLGNGRDAVILGVSEQWRADSQRRCPYLYGGAVSNRRLNAALFAEIRRAIGDLVRWWGLRGLNGLDLVVDRGDYYVLELNARPTATVELYQAGAGYSLFEAHVQACRGQSLPGLAPAAGRHAHMPVYSEAELRVPPDFAWPQWCSDLPEAGSCIRPGEPLCTVHASGDSARGLRDLLLERARRLQGALLPEWGAGAQPPAFGSVAAWL